MSDEQVVLSKGVINADEPLVFDGSIWGPYICNPLYPYTYFPYDKEKKHIMFGLLHARIPDSKSLSGARDTTSAETEQLCQDIKKQLNLQYFDWCFSCGRTLLSVGLEDLPKIYDVVWAIMNYHWGCGVYMQDGTQVTFDAGDPPPTRETQEAKLLERLLNLKSSGYKNPMDLIQLPLYRDAFWTSEGGKAYARDLRAYLKLEDKRDSKNCYIGEHFEEVVKQNKRQKVEVVEGWISKEEVCVVCMEKPTSTFVLPCRHRVCCKECSDKLKEGPDHAKTHCVLCNTLIEEVVEDSK